MKRILLIVLSLIPFISFSQNDIKRMEWKPENIMNGLYIASYNLGIGIHIDQIAHTYITTTKTNSDGTVSMRIASQYCLVPIKGGYIPGFFPTVDSLCSFLNAKRHSGYRLASRYEVIKYIHNVAYFPVEKY